MAESEQFFVDAALSGMRLDAALCQLLTQLTRSQAQQLIAKGMVLHNGSKAAKSCRLSQGDQLTVQLPPPVPVDILPQNIPVRPLCQYY